jgi:octaprenyl-diphosphate synthase
MTMPTSPRRSMDSSPATSSSDHAPWKEIRPFQRIDASLRRVHGLIHAALDPQAVPEDLSAFLGHLRAGRGKMLRPALVLLAGECCAALTDKHLQVSAMVEMIHHATLLHDDVIDDGSQRRGVPTINHLWGNESAVLLGDFILSHVFRMAADLEPEVARVLAQTAVRVCEGELRQTVQKGNWRLSEAQYLEIITEKSASFLSGCCRLGAMLSHARPEQVEALARFGLWSGIAFQITDDLLDLTGSENHTGKTSQCDLAKDKPTLAVIHLLTTIDPARRAEVDALLETPNKARTELLDLLTRHGSLQYAGRQAADYVKRATHELEGLPAGPARDALAETAHFMAHRLA